MDELKECKVCGYKKPKNGNRIIKPVSLNITILEDHTMKILYAKEDIPMCNICIDSLKSCVEDFFFFTFLKSHY